MAEVEIPYVGGPLGMQDERELLADWELADGAPGATEGYVYEHRPAARYSDADPNEVHRYVLTRRRGTWEFIYEPDLAGMSTATSGGYTDDEVAELADVLTEARMRGVFVGHYTLARMILDAGYRKVAP